MLTAAVRDLQIAHPGKYEVSVQTTALPIWDNNPHVKQCWLNPSYKPAGAYTHVACHYPAIIESNRRPNHFVSAFHEYIGEKLGIRIPVTRFGGDVYMSEAEMESPIEELRIGAPKYWVMVAGGKYDFTTKWWPRSHYQAVVDTFKDRIHFVQLGEAHHHHPYLKNVTNLVGRTSLRQFLRLIYHAQGVVCPVTFAMHAAAAVPVHRPPYELPVEEGLGRHCCHGTPLRPCVVIAGGREAPHWESYPGHRFLHNVGALPCCAHGGCYRNRCHKLMDNDAKDSHHTCLEPVFDEVQGVHHPLCMTMIHPDHVCQAIVSYYQGGVLEYL